MRTCDALALRGAVGLVVYAHWRAVAQDRAGARGVAEDGAAVALLRQYLYFCSSNRSQYLYFCTRRCCRGWCGCRPSASVFVPCTSIQQKKIVLVKQTKKRRCIVWCYCRRLFLYLYIFTSNAGKLSTCRQRLRQRARGRGAAPSSLCSRR